MYQLSKFQIPTICISNPVQRRNRILLHFLFSDGNFSLDLPNSLPARTSAILLAALWDPPTKGGWRHSGAGGAHLPETSELTWIYKETAWAWKKGALYAFLARKYADMFSNSNASLYLLSNQGGCLQIGGVWILKLYFLLTLYFL